MMKEQILEIKNTIKVLERRKYDMIDVIIIGAGPAGISAGLYTKRGNINTMILYQDGSSLEKADRIDNYYGVESGTSGKTIYENGIKQAQKLGIDVRQEEVVKIEMLEHKFQIVTSHGEYETRAVIFATGNKKNTPKVKGIKEFEGKGVSYCAVCDGFFYRNRSIGVLGSGNYAVSETNELIHIANDVTILTNGEKAPQVRADNVEMNEKKIKEVRGHDRIEEVVFEDDTSQKIDGLFVASGVAGSGEFARKLGVVTQRNNIVVDENMQTNILGIYACGDCTGGLLQISKSVYEGTKAGLAVVKYIRENQDKWNI